MRKEKALLLLEQIEAEEEGHISDIIPKATPLPEP